MDVQEKKEDVTGLKLRSIGFYANDNYDGFVFDTRENDTPYDYVQVIVNEFYLGLIDNTGKEVPITYNLYCMNQVIKLIDIIE